MKVTFPRKRINKKPVKKLDYRKGSNQYQKKRKVTVGGMCGAILFLSIGTLAGLHYLSIGVVYGSEKAKDWSKDTFRGVAHAPTKLVSPLPVQAEAPTPAPGS